MAQSLFVSIDVSREPNSTAFHSTAGELTEPVFTITNIQVGVEALLEKQHRHLTETPDLHVVIGCKVRGISRFHLLQAPPTLRC